MQILILYGPNLNLLGLVSRNTGDRLTLDKINRALRRKAGELNVELKIYQDQSESNASKIVQRQRNKVEGIILIPGIWVQTGYLLRETVEITGLPLAVFHLAPQAGPWDHEKASIFEETAGLVDTGSTMDALTAFLENFVNQLKA
ncbi:MAG: type II 3-dehydroquinate dehydratase [Fidelibacterota bacterium]|nr:MAG: type II 3-dehydroquinate dehydratase [Candidatus Neomarinimicrobiota bacterium]